MEAIKREFAQYRQSFSHRLSMRISNDDSMGSASKLGESTFRGEQDTHEKILDLHNEIFNLKNQNYFLERQLKYGSVETAIKVEDGLETLKKERAGRQSGARQLNEDSSSDKRYSYSAASQSPSYIQTSTQYNQQSMHIY